MEWKNATTEGPARRSKASSSISKVSETVPEGRSLRLYLPLSWKLEKSRTFQSVLPHPGTWVCAEAVPWKTTVLDASRSWNAVSAMLPEAFFTTAVLGPVRS
jgi:hypothetical protein